MSSTDKRKVAKNTAFLYLRMLIVMGVSLFTVRIVLENLGVVDYGIYNVIGGISSSFIFFQTALTNATQRYLSFDIGTKNYIRLGNIFNLSLEIYTGISILVLLLGVTLGTWFVRNKLNIPNDDINAGCIVLYATLISLISSFIGSVYEAVLIARENMKIYAYIGLFDAIAKLISAYSIVLFTEHRLIIYSLLLAFFSILPKVYMIGYCNRKFYESKIHYYWNRQLFKEIFSFSGWNIYGTSVWMLNQQGVNILLNLFFGPVVNAARGIAFQVTNVVNNFSTNFFTAVKPQIIKSYASNEKETFENLIFLSSKLSVFLIWFLCLPILLRIDYVLLLWLKEVPEDTALFVRWVIIFLIVDALNNPLWTAVQAVGQLRKTILYGSSFFLLAFPLSYIFLKIGFGAWVVYPILIVTRIGYLIITYNTLNEYFSISSSQYFSNVLYPIIKVLILSMVTMYLINLTFKDNFISLILICSISVIINALCIFFIGINKVQRLAIINKLRIHVSKVKNSN